MDEAACWLLLQRAPGLKGATVKRLLDDFASGDDLVRAARDRHPSLMPVTQDYLQSPDWDAVMTERRWLDAPGHHLVTLADALYPPLLREVTDPPILLFVNGAPEVLSRPQLALVGSRHPTPAGAETAYAFARHLAALGLTITSGLAMGIDSAGHRGALEGGGPSVAVVGTGLDRVYPSRNRELAHRLAGNGALASEFSLGAPPRAYHFPRRNRIIAGLSLGTLVVEAAANSGSLITARLAVEEGREVFAIPGSIHNPLARGCHALIREGAKLVEKVQDVLDELTARFPAEGGTPSLPVGPDCSPTVAHGGEDLAGDYQRLLTYMGFDPVSVDRLVERSGLTAEAVSSMLLLLELRGHVTSLGGGLYARASREIPNE